MFLIVVGLVILVWVGAFLFDAFAFFREVFDAIKTLFEKKPPTHSFTTAVVTHAFDHSDQDSEPQGKVEADGATWNTTCSPEEGSRI